MRYNALIFKYMEALCNALAYWLCHTGPIGTLGTSSMDTGVSGHTYPQSVNRSMRKAPPKPVLFVPKTTHKKNLNLPVRTLGLPLRPSERPVCSMGSF